jgi:hypothetical protein
MNVDSILPNDDAKPYYVYAPRYTRASAGIRVLHLLCHWLNRSGQRAFIVPFQREPQYVSLDLLTPVLTQEIEQHHRNAGASPIVIYPEVISGNPLNAEFVVRYVLNYPGLLGGDRSFDSSEMVWVYSKHLASCVDRFDGILHMPVVDQKIFHAKDCGERSGTVFYATKYRKIHGQDVFDIPADATEITRDLPDSPSPMEIADMLRKAEYFFCFENTALATEAVLCGCPAVFMPNAYLSHPIAVDELGWDGFAWGASPEELLRAKSSVGLASRNYQATVRNFHNQLDDFISKTQNVSRKSPGAAVRVLHTQALYADDRSRFIERLTRLLR